MPGANNIPAPPTDRLTVILTLLRHFIAAQSHAKRANPVLVRLFRSRISFCLNRFRALVANPPKPRRTPRHRPTSLNPKPRTQPINQPITQPINQPINPSAGQPPITLPRGRGALLRLLPSYQIRGVASQLRHLLNEADMIALVSEIPQLSRTLRPLCHMLAIPLPPHLRPPPRPYPARRKPRAKPRSKSRTNPPANSPPKRPKPAWAAAPSNQPPPKLPAPQSQHPPNPLYPDFLNFR
ncbi:MAG: hypothetical protein ACP5M1_04075 [Acidiphilium sp.]